MSGHEDLGFNPNDFINSINNDKPRKRKKYYKSSSYNGAHIVNAETGQTMKHKVGSLDESRYFTVMVNDGKEGVKLFYNSPEQYESHRNMSIDDNVKIEWHNREYERRISEINNDDEDETTGEDTIVK